MCISAQIIWSWTVKKIQCTVVIWRNFLCWFFTVFLGFVLPVFWIMHCIVLFLLLKEMSVNIMKNVLVENYQYLFFYRFLCGGIWWEMSSSWDLWLLIADFGICDIAQADVSGSQISLTFHYWCLSSRSQENIDICRSFQIILFQDPDVTWLLPHSVRLVQEPLCLKSFRSDSIISVYSFFIEYHVISFIHWVIRTNKQKWLQSEILFLSLVLFGFRQVSNAQHGVLLVWEGLVMQHNFPDDLQLKLLIPQLVLL